MKLICPYCEHKWHYAGKDQYITCPSCFECWTLTEDEYEVHKRQMGIVETEDEDEEEYIEFEVTEGDESRIVRIKQSEAELLKNTERGDATN